MSLTKELESRLEALERKWDALDSQGRTTEQYQLQQEMEKVRNQLRLYETLHQAAAESEASA